VREGDITGLELLDLAANGHHLTDGAVPRIDLAAAELCDVLCSAETARMRKCTSRGPIGRSTMSSNAMTFAMFTFSGSSPTRLRSAAMASAEIE
jgi:hypothetical protein